MDVQRIHPAFCRKQLIYELGPFDDHTACRTRYVDHFVVERLEIFIYDIGARAKRIVGHGRIALPEARVHVYLNTGKRCLGDPRDLSVQGSDLSSWFVRKEQTPILHRKSALLRLLCRRQNALGDFLPVRWIVQRFLPRLERMEKFQVQPSARRENRMRSPLTQKFLLRAGMRHLVAGAGTERRKHLHIAFNPRPALERKLLGHRRIDVHPQRQLRQHQIPDDQGNRQSDLSGGDRTATLARFGVVRRETHHERYAFARRQRNRGRKTDDLFRICEIFLGDVRRRLGICGKERIRSIHGRISLNRPETSSVNTHHSADTEFSGHITVESVNGQLHLLRRAPCVHHRKVARLRFVARHCQFNGFSSARSGIFRHADNEIL